MNMHIGHPRTIGAQFGIELTFSNRFIQLTVYLIITDAPCPDFFFMSVDKRSSSPSLSLVVCLSRHVIYLNILHRISIE